MKQSKWEKRQEKKRLEKINARLAGDTDGLEIPPMTKEAKRVLRQQPRRNRIVNVDMAEVEDRISVQWFRFNPEATANTITATEVKERQSMSLEVINKAMQALAAQGLTDLIDTNAMKGMWDDTAVNFVPTKIKRISLYDPSLEGKFEDPQWTILIQKKLSSLNADTRNQKPGERDMALADQYTQELARLIEQLKQQGAPPQILEREAQRFFQSAPDWMKGEVQEMMRGMMNSDPRATRYYEEKIRRPSEDRSATAMALKQAKEQIQEMSEILERIKDDALILHRVDRLDKDKKFCYVKKADLDLRVKAPPKLERGDEVLLHPKTFQIVEHLGKPPLEASPFSPAEIPNVTWDDIGGLEAAKADMIEAIELPHKFKELFAYYKKRPIKGILLSGPPGCGKTMLGKAAARSLATIYGKESVRSGFLYVKGPEILNMFVGQTEQTIRDIFFDAGRHRDEHGYPAVIFLDEADAILGARGQGGMTSSLGSTIVPQFLTEMDGLEDSSAIVIIATNRPDVLDPAIVRDGRCDRKISVTRPDEDNSAKIIALNLKRCPLVKPNTVEALSSYAADLIFDLERFIKQGKRLSTVVNGAMLANVVDFAVSYAIRRDMAMNEQTGIMKEDIASAVEAITEQQAAVRHDLEVEA